MKCKVDANYSEWRMLKKLDSNKSIYERVSNQFGIRQMAIFTIFGDKMIRTSRITQEYMG